MRKTLLDTDTYSEVIKGKNALVTANAVAYLSFFKQYTLSAMTVIEVITGYQRRGQQTAIQTFLQDIAFAEVFEIDRETAVLAGQIDGDLRRTGQLVGLEDAIIAATAIRHNSILTTGNTKHHQRIVNLGYALQRDNWKTI